MMAANYRHIGDQENRLGRHYSRFRAFSPAVPLARQSLAAQKFRSGGSNRRSQASSCACQVTRALATELLVLWGAEDRGIAAGVVTVGAAATAVGAGSASRRGGGGRSTGFTFGVGLGGCGAESATRGCGAGLASSLRASGSGNGRGCAWGSDCGV